MTPSQSDNLVLAFYGIDANVLATGDDQVDGGTGWTTEFIRETTGGGANTNITCGVSFKTVGAVASLDSSQALSIAENYHSVQIAFLPEPTGFPHSQGIIIG